jgi:two-component system, NtrC family, sensor kinase
MLQFMLIVMLNISSATRSDQLFVASDSLFSENGIISLGGMEGWRFHPGDDLSWAQPDYDDSDWMFYKPAGLTDPIPDSLWEGFGWFRYQFAADSSIYAMARHLYFSTRGAAEVYLDGKLVRKCGEFSKDPQGEKRYMPGNKTHPAVVLQHAESHVLAVRFSYHKGQQYKKLLGKYALTFGFNIGLAKDNLNQQVILNNNRNQQRVYILGTMLFLIVLLHSLLFALFPSEQSNLYIAIVALLLFMHIVLEYGSVFFEFDILQETLFRTIPFNILFIAVLSMFPFTINSMFKQKPQIIHKILIWLFPIIALTNFIISDPFLSLIIATVFILVIIFFTTQALIQAMRNKQKGVWIISAAVFGLILSAIVWTFYMAFSNNNRGSDVNAVLTYFIYGSVPVGLTAFMASRFRDLYTGLEQRVRERTRDLQQSLEELRSTQSQLIHSEKLASLGALTAGIAHEIQNPLNFVNNFSEVNKELISDMREEIAKKNFEEVNQIAKDIEENEDKIIHHGKRADSIVKGMLQHSRSNSGLKEPTDINALADEYLRLSYHGMRAKDKSFNAEFKTNFDPHLPKINVVPQDIGRVLLNLINNAFYAVQVKTHGGASLQQTPLPYKPTVTVSTQKNSHGIEITVKDNGPGIPDNIKDKIFQPFFTTKPTGQGTGLGLSLAYDIVKAHGGEIRIESNEGEGSAFLIQLPYS